MLDPDKVRSVALDADDTLWMNETIFVRTQDACKAIVGPYLDDPHVLEARLYEFERKNLRLFGYGIKGFMLSMIETVVELTEHRVSGTDIQRIIDLGKAMLEHPIHLLETIEDSVPVLAERYHLILITKGDLFDQENKLARSGLGHHFRAVEIVSEKDRVTYAGILERHGIAPDEFLMVGNSLKSDILPALQIGGQAVHIPHQTNWELDRVCQDELADHRYTELQTLGALVERLVLGSATG